MDRSSVGSLVSLLLPLAMASGCRAPAVAAADLAPVAVAVPAEPFVIEYYYKAKWGFAAEFIELFKRNYLPQIEEMQRQGRILDYVAHVPRHHASEESRWDFRLQITWRDALTAHDDHHPEAVIARLFPDREKHRAEEKRRFELLIAHWDVLVEEEELVPPAPAG